ncbi:hypothetical protein GFS60_03932 [Rhodococcus sp. WAY2]|nr:hypothetical protein GFS60_03932 [Rhodococcus sp. WAY2]
MSGSFIAEQPLAGAVMACRWIRSTRLRKSCPTATHTPATSKVLSPVTLFGKRNAVTLFCS